VPIVNHPPGMGANADVSADARKPAIARS